MKIFADSIIRLVLVERIKIQRLCIPLMFIALVLVSCPSISHAQDQNDLMPDVANIEKAQVLEATQPHAIIVPGTDTPETIQTLKAQVLEGPDKNKVVTFENDFTQLNAGDIFYIRHEHTSDGIDYWTVSDAYRLNVLIGLGVVFLVLLFVFGGTQGLRGLVTLVGSLVLIFYVLVPGILSGYSPALVSIGVAALIIIAGSYITHGFNRTTSAAVLGMLITVLITGMGTYYVIYIGHFTGYLNEESVYLNSNTHGTLNIQGLLLGGIMIGLLGVLYDIAIGQAIAVEELFRAGMHMTRSEIYTRAIRIGREHIGALVNTLAIAYVGVALPLLLLSEETYSSSTSIGSVINGEIFAAEIVRILIGSIGLILSVPITTWIATYMLSSVHPRAASEKHIGHHH